MNVETSPPAQTLYLDIDLGPASKSPVQRTAVFFPAAYEATTSPDAVVYLHGYGAGAIDEYLRDPRFPLREETNRADAARTASLIVIAPTLGPASEAGDLVAEGLAWYLNAVLEGVRKAAPDRLVGDAPGFRDVCVAAHSGGGRPMRALAMASSAVAEYWAFDAFYAPAGYAPRAKTSPTAPIGDPDAVEEEWLHVLETQPVTLASYYATSEPTIRSQNLQRFVSASESPLPGKALIARSTTAVHDAVPRTHWKERIEQRA
jgi:hypothetical protein